MNCTRKILCAGLALCAAGASWAMPQAPQQVPQGAPGSQSPGQPPTLQGPDPRAKIRTTVSLVVVPVTVKNGAGELVSDLQQKDFRIFEDGIEQQISLFSVDAFPLSAAVLIDDDLKRSSADRVQKTLETLAAGFIPSDEVSLWRFDEVPELISESGFIADNDALLTQLKRIDLSSSFPGVGSAVMTSEPRVNTQSPTGAPKRSAMSIGHPNYKHINDAIYAAGEQLRDRPREQRKIIFLISDGQNAKNNTHSYDETLKLLLSADISVYALGVGEANLNRGITFLGNSILSKYAHATGGDIFYASSREDLEGLYPRVSEQARNQYTLGYSASKTDRTQAYHSIEVRVERPGLSMLARDGYYLNALP
jgi:VWFA-related protein